MVVINIFKKIDKKNFARGLEPINMVHENSGADKHNYQKISSNEFNSRLGSRILLKC